MSTTVHYVNGTPEGEDPMTVLCSRLQDMTLEPRWGHPRCDEDGVTYFTGNFVEFSSAFRVETTDRETIARLSALVEANMARPAYVHAKAEHEADKARQARVFPRLA